MLAFACHFDRHDVDGVLLGINVGAQTNVVTFMAFHRLERGEPEPWEVEEKRYEWASPEATGHLMAAC